MIILRDTLMIAPGVPLVPPKTCASCGQVKTAGKFGPKRQTCYCCLNLRSRDQRRARGHEMKVYIESIKLARGNCEACKTPVTQDTLSSFHWDHLNPETKTASVSSMTWRSRATVDAEIAQCQVLCVGCHAKHTSAQHRSGAIRSGPRPDRLIKR